MPRADRGSFEAVDIPNVPIARLPPEILAVVFSILSSISRPRREEIYPHTPSKLRYKLGWLTITHVCQRWRNIALCDPVLWASNIALPSMLGHCWAAAYLSRAQNIPLTVTRSTEGGADINFIGANLARIDAILYLVIGRHELLKFCTPAPLLHTLDLEIYDQKPQLPLLPDGLFGGAAGLPELRHLSVRSSGCWEQLSWTPLLLQQLVSVKITMNSHDLPIVLLASMFAALGRMRGLEQLVLGLPVTPGDTDRMPVTLLPTLQHLSLRADVRNARFLLAHLALPAGVRVSCDLHWTVFTTAELSTLFSEMVAIVDTRATPITRVAEFVTHTPPTQYAVLAWRSGDIDDAPALDVEFTGRQDLPSALGFLPLKHVTHLELLANGIEVPAAWLDAVKSAPRLRHVTVERDAVPPFCAALERALGILPALSTLVIDVRSCTHPLAETVLGDALPRCLAARAHAGHLLEELEVVEHREHRENEACAHALREAVPGLVVRWRWESKLVSEYVSDSDDFTEEEDEEEE
ncbi:hypothetical protein FA95DRAFT_1679965 [Auriscalpium vulgare]|uniref:Uncharacterized protein n=1 Tax=Auriscalpium vulgare TaxID=40419 RepID=A0ACB8RQ43_9AGAM|nr:hypothetical protein FA95DRAFT_1679965 [Auriscalpium vulgare]